MLIVDAFNVVHAAMDVDPRLGGLRVESLCALIAGSRWGGGGAVGPAVVVVDGTGGGLAGQVSPEQHLSGVRVQFAGPGKDADSAIELLLEDQERKRSAHKCTVVSSDRRLKAAAAGVRARWMSSADFLRTLIDDAGKAAAKDRARSGGKPATIVEVGESGLGEIEAAYWLKEFGADAPAKAKPDARPQKGDARAAGVPMPSAEEALRRQIEQEWGERVSPDDLDMSKLLGGAGTTDARRRDEDDDAGGDTTGNKKGRKKK
jgi:hypothetical protein